MKRISLLFFVFIFVTSLFSGDCLAGAYKNFHVAVYCTVSDVKEMADMQRLEMSYEALQKYFIIDKVYLETHRRGFLIDEATLLKVKGFFDSKGVSTSGGITTTGTVPIAGKFANYCFTDAATKEHLKKVVQFTARHFDEIILDDFFFTPCKCESCRRAKGDRSWTDFRLDLMRDISKNVIIKAAKEVNPNVNTIIKYPNWYAYYQFTGYDLMRESRLFDMIYTGTETRDPVYHQQHLQPYQSYAIMRYLENVKPGKNGGGWVDPLAKGTLDRYAGQLELTLLAKAREITLFHYGALLEWIRTSAAGSEPISDIAPVAGYVFRKMDSFLDKLGEPVGLPSYRPFNSSGESYLHSYLGMIGIPIELTPTFPAESQTILLTEAAKFDPDIVAKIKKHLVQGKKVVITSGLLHALQGKGIKDIISARYTDKKVLANAFTDFKFTQLCKIDAPVLLPKIDFPTNDAWMEIAAMTRGGDSYPLVLQAGYGKGLIYVLTIPDDFTDLYRLPRETLSQIKQMFLNDFDVAVQGPAQVALFLYDNNTFLVYSFLPHKAKVDIIINKKSAELVDLISGGTLKVDMIGEKTVHHTILAPNSYKVYKWK